MQRAMEREVAANRQRRRDRLDEAARAQRRAPGARSRACPTSPRSSRAACFATRVWVGERREQAIVVGVPDFARQRADVVARRLRCATAGAGRPDRSQQRRAQRRLRAATPATRACSPPTATSATLPISGVGRNLTGGEDDPSNDWITFYATRETVAALSGAPGYTSLGLRLRDTGRAAAERTVAAVRDRAARDDRIHRASTTCR